jgi:hypothetical protein
MTPKPIDDKLTKSHKVITVSLIPLMLSVIVYFLIKIDKKIDVAAEAVIKHEQQLHDQDRRINKVENLVFQSRF